jgi:hypothetical protein
MDPAMAAAMAAANDCRLRTGDGGHDYITGLSFERSGGHRYNIREPSG